MKVHSTMRGGLIRLAFIPGLLAVPLLAQPQIGGGTCSSASLNGKYSATLNGRDLNSTVAFTSAVQGIGSVTFDGLSKVTFTLSNNSNKFFGVAQTLSGTYTMQSNCIGALNLTTGDNASFTLEAYNNGNSYLMTGQDGVYAFTGNGAILPATCPAAIPTGSYSFNGTGFGLGSGSISNVFSISGVIQISGTNNVTITSYMTASTGINSNALSGTVTVSPNCSATATLTDTTGTGYTVSFELTSANGQNFILSSSSPLNIFTGSGRSL